MTARATGPLAGLAVDATMDRFRDILRRARRAGGMTQLALAGAVGVTRSYINMVERGKVRPPSTGVVARLEDALGLTEGELQFLAALDRMPAKSADMIRQSSGLDEADAGGLRDLLDVLGSEINAAWRLPDEKREAARRMRPFLTDPSPHVRQLACGLLGRLAWSGSQQDLRAALADRDERVREEAARLVGTLSEQTGAQLLEIALRDTRPCVRVAAVAGIARRPSESTTAMLARCARDDKSADVRRAAVEAVARHPSARATSALEALTRHTDPAVAAASRAQLERRAAPAYPLPASRTVRQLQAAIHAVESSNASRVDLHVIPVISRAAAGDPARFTDGDYPPGFADEYVQAPTDVADPNAFGLRIRGDSMTPMYHPGDVVIVSPNTPLAPGLRVVAKIRNGEITCKTLASSENDQITLASENPSYDPIILPREDVVWLYPVVCSLRNELPL